MQTQKLDTKRSYGTVFNHDQIAYVQDGMCFDASGEFVKQDTVKSVVKQVVEKPIKKSSKKVQPTKTDKVNLDATSFLEDILSENPLSQSVIKKQSEAVGLIWADINQAAAELGIHKYKQGNINMWKLGEKK